ncbi:MAG: alkyl hydroperoxide reductase [Planctomycetes bacterium]|nr:alkyl hydroperoxide reductase [Planctomycetota bacterium]
MSSESGPRWARPVLLAAAAYNLLFGALVVLFPLGWFAAAGMPPPDLPCLWQCIGMVVGVYGVGYACAAAAPLRHWPIVLVGLAGKLLGPVGFVDAAVRGQLPWRAGWLIVANDMLWWLPFALLLRAAWVHHQARRP